MFRVKLCEIILQSISYSRLRVIHGTYYRDDQSSHDACVYLVILQTLRRPMLGMRQDNDGIEELIKTPGLLQVVLP